MTIGSKNIAMAFSDILEFLFEKITNFYRQFISYLSYIRIQPKLDFLLKLYIVLWNHHLNILLLFWNKSLIKYIYIKQCSYFSDIKSFWTILNNQLVIDTIDKLNGRGKASSISCFDFSTLYTKVLHNKSLMVLNELIHFYFRGEDGEFISLDSHGGKWT